MGLLDIFKKKKEDKRIEPVSKKEQKAFDTKYAYTSDGRLQVDFKKFYDTTRLIVRESPISLDGQDVYNCIVSWYGQDDARMIDERGNLESPRANDYRGVLAQIDINLLKSNPAYCSMVMKQLLDKQRVERYLQTGLEDMPEQPCGKYIGGIKQTENGYGKFFALNVGKASHYSDLMVNRRQENRERKEAIRQKKIAEKQAEIEKLQKEIEEIEK